MLDHVHLRELDAAKGGDDNVLPHVDVFRSVRTGGDTRTRKSRRSLAIPQRAVRAMRKQRARQDTLRRRAGNRWQENGLVFPSEVGTEMDRTTSYAGSGRSSTMPGTTPGLDTAESYGTTSCPCSPTPRCPSRSSRAWSDTATTRVIERVYRHQLRPVIEEGANEMDRIVPDTAAK